MVMDWVMHRINTIDALKGVPRDLGVEVDLRSEGKRIKMHHDAFVDGEDFENFLKFYDHGLLVLNIKEAGIEGEVLHLVEKFKVKNYFLLDVEFPYIYRASRSGVRSIAMRYSEDESIETVLKYKSLVDWVWIDTNTQLPLDEKIVDQLKPFKTCLVCPERWGRPEDIKQYAVKMNTLGFWPDAIMTSMHHLSVWKNCKTN